ncbi:MAG: alpha/beta fold hydrolase [Cyanobacteria bacterium P01_G01_bin.54]
MIWTIAPRTLFRWSLLGLSAIGAILGLGLYFVTNHLLYPGQPEPDPAQQAILADPDASGFTIQSFIAQAEDGVTLQAYLLTPTLQPGTTTHYKNFATRLRAADISVPTHDAAARGTILMLHGISARKEQNLAIAERLVVAGYRCILYDSRAHGESGGEFVSYGWREVADAQAVLAAAIAQFDTLEHPLAPFGLFGQSLGASVGLQLVPEEPHIQSAVLVSPFSRLEDVMAETAQPYLGRWGTELLLPLVAQVIRWRTRGSEPGFEGGFDPGAIAPVQAAEQVNVPVLLIHGQADDVIFPHHGQRNYAAIAHPDKIWRPVPEGTHQDVLAVGGDALYQEMVEFYQRTLKHN